jgi:hypothetical protein
MFLRRASRHDSRAQSNTRVDFKIRRSGAHRAVQDEIFSRLGTFAIFSRFRMLPSGASLLRDRTSACEAIAHGCYANQD